MKKLVVYYSYTGNTKKIADMIKSKLDCDILELEPLTPFSKDYDEVVNEYQNNSIDNKEVPIKDINANLDDYDEIIIGTPVWWYTISPVVVTFLKENDLSNKTIYPFATNAGWLGKTFKDIEKLCPNSKIEKEMNIVFESYSDKLKTTEKELNDWINSIEK
ncbi:Flavodoxin [human gut metagenome]|jgi:flavodoxins|uniref:Flavodoxin n=1 Tax=human gut metagenome TaxID=408170 RepID=K1SDZ1_9ZZZZ